MEAYFKGQRVEIVAVDNEHLRMRYPAIDKYVGDIGTVVGACPINLKTRESEAYLYFIRLGQYNRIVAVPHEALKRYFT
jgi:hypothetical protein